MANKDDLFWDAIGNKKVGDKKKFRFKFRIRKGSKGVDPKPLAELYGVDPKQIEAVWFHLCYFVMVKNFTRYLKKETIFYDLFASTQYYSFSLITYRFIHLFSDFAIIIFLKVCLES